MSAIASSRPADLAEIIAGVQLNDVRLVDASVRTRIRDVSRLGDTNLVLRHKTQVIRRSEQAFMVAAAMRAEVVREGEDALVVMDITFALEYRLENATRFSDQDLAEFARVNGAFNAWPYWREYVQATSARMNLPPITLPVFRVRPRTDSEHPSHKPGELSPAKRKELGAAEVLQAKSTSAGGTARKKR